MYHGRLSFFSLIPSLFYSLSTAFSIIFISQLVTRVNPMLSLLISVSLATLFFHLINYKKLKQTYRPFFIFWKRSIVLNLVVAIIWISVFLGLSMIDPYLYIVIYFVVSSIISFFIIFMRTKKQIFLLSSLLLLIIIAVCIAHYLYLHHAEIRTLGIGFAILSGIFSYFYRAEAKTYSVITKNSASMILCVRSYGILLCSFIFYLSMLHLHWESPLIQVTDRFLVLMLLVVVFSFVIPLYCNQKGIENAGPEMHSIVCASIPIITLLLSQLSQGTYRSEQTVFNYSTAILVLILLVLPNFRGILKRG